MTLSTLVISIALIALILTAVMGAFSGKVQNWLVSYLQNFTGALFVFSGLVKAVDPLGTAYKMEQYFAEFESLFEGTWFAFLGPLFPWLNEYALTFSVVMIVLEIVLGLMLLLGAARRFTSWAFLLLVVFFTFLTGFTYLTGYVPEGVHFFQFGQWGEYVATNMKVTDCGCFGDFLKLEPRISFFKDLVLLLPALLFVWMPDKMHQLLSSSGRWAILAAVTVGLTVYCFSNFAWDIPHVDFRPFKEGVNIRERKALEEEAEANVEILAYRMTNKETGQVVELPYQQYLKEFQQYPKETWKLEQVKSEPEVLRTKISDFEISDVDNNEVTEELLSLPGYNFMIVAYKLYGDAANWPADYLAAWTETVNPVITAAEAAGLPVYAVTAFADPARIDDFRHASQSAYPFYQADDILLKTIVRSNPGIVLLKDGEIIGKWHYKQLPAFEEIQEKYMD